MTIRLTVEDLDSDSREVNEFDDDYCVTTAGRAYVSRIQTYQNGTHVITVKRPGKTFAIAQSIEFDPPNRPESEVSE